MSAENHILRYKLNMNNTDKNSQILFSTPSILRLKLSVFFSS